MNPSRPHTCRIYSGPLLLVLIDAMPATLARADPATVVSFDWGIEAAVTASAVVGPACPSTGCNVAQNCPHKSDAFTRGGSTLPPLFSENPWASADCSRWCHPCCDLGGGAAGSGRANAGISIQNFSGPSQTRWIFGGVLSSSVLASGGTLPCTGTADATARIVQRWELRFLTECARLNFSRTLSLNNRGTGAFADATNSISLIGPAGTLFAQTLTTPPPGTQIGGTASSEFILTPGVYTLTIETLIELAVSFPDPPSGSRTFGAYGACDLTLRPYAGPAITAGPRAATACTGGSASFSVVAAGLPDLAYQWRRAGVNLLDGPTGTGSTISGAQTALLTILNVSSADAATWSNGYDCAVSDACGTTTPTPHPSTVAALTVVSGGSGDGNGDGRVDGRDIQGFVNAIVSGGPPSIVYCAYDFDASGVVDTDDLPLFTSNLLE